MANFKAKTWWHADNQFNYDCHIAKTQMRWEISLWELSDLTTTIVGITPCSKCITLELSNNFSRRCNLVWAYSWRSRTRTLVSLAVIISHCTDEMLCVLTRADRKQLVETSGYENGDFSMFNDNTQSAKSWIVTTWFSFHLLWQPQCPASFCYTSHTTRSSYHWMAHAWWQIPVHQKPVQTLSRFLEPRHLVYSVTDW